MSEEQGEFLGTSKGDAVEVSEYDPEWPRLFQGLASRLRAALGESALRIDHVGSTAVPGLAAKPVIDAQVSITDLEDEASYRPRMESLGLELRYRDESRRFFRPPETGPRTVHVHVCEAGSRAERDHLLFAAYLREHTGRRDEYAALKRDLARRFRYQREEYLAAKEPFIRDTLSLAAEWCARTDRLL